MALEELKVLEDFVRELITTDKYYSVEYDSAQSVRGLTKVPLISKYKFNSGFEYKVVAKAQEEKAIKIDETGDVSTLEIYNQANYPVLIPCGSLFISQKNGRQDRALTTDVMIGPGEKLKVPVACVEEYRWGPRSSRESRRILRSIGARNIEDSDFYVKYFTSPRVTEALVGSISNKFRSSFTPYVSHYMFRADQSGVWQEIKKEIIEADVNTPTKAFTEVVMKKGKEENIEFDIYDGEIGDIFIGRGRVLGMELYETPNLWQSICDQTIKRYKMSVDKEQNFDIDLIYKFLSDLSKCGVKAAKSIGLGYDIRLIEGEVEGACLVIGNYAPAHFTVVPSREAKVSTHSVD